MALINLRTNLKSLKYGKDTPGGGDSGQPYIQSSIPEGYTNKSPDFILRGGLLATQNSLEDVARLGRMFGDLKSPNGLLFIAKQNLLSRSAVPSQGGNEQGPKLLNEGIYTPLSTLAQAGVVAFGGHLNKQGLNPFSPTGAYIESSFLTSLGSNVGDLRIYSQLVNNQQSKEQNRLVKLYNNKISTKTSDPNILSYNGGPGSILGIGTTNIRFADQRTGINNRKDTDWLSYLPNPDSLKSRYQIAVSASISSSFGNSVSKMYNERNGIELDIPIVDGKYIYSPFSSVGLDGTLFNTYNTGSFSWTPNTGPLKPWSETATSASISSSFGDSVSKIYSKRNNIKLGIPEVDGKYIYGPFSEIGRYGTLFNTYTINQGHNQEIERSFDLLIFKTTYKNGVSNKYKLYTSSSIDNTNNQPSVYTSGSFKLNPDTFYSQNSISFNQELINSQSLNSLGSPKIQDFREIIRSGSNGLNRFKITQAESEGLLSKAPNYNKFGYERRVNIGGKDGLGPGYKGSKNLSSYSSSGIGPVDKINALPIYQDENVASNNIYPTNDLVKFRIAVIYNNKPNLKQFIHFRAFINSFSDNYNATWGTSNYLGRGESFYNYSNFARDINLSFTVAAQSKEELITMYKKLNFLASTLTPDYSPNGYMRGCLVQLTMGGYLYEQPGFISALNYTINDDTTWEIGINDEGGSDPNVKELPHRIEVSTFNFTPIHNFRPQKQELLFNGNGFPNTYGPEHYIALSSENGVSNYTINGEFRNFNT